MFQDSQELDLVQFADSIDDWQMMQQGRGDLAVKSSDGKIVTRRKAAQFKQQRARRGTRGSAVIPASGSGGAVAAPKMDRADFFARKQSGLARVRKGYIQRPVSRGKARRLPMLPAVGQTNSPLSKRSNAGKKAAQTRVKNETRRRNKARARTGK